MQAAPSNLQRGGEGVGEDTGSGRQAVCDRGSSLAGKSRNLLFFFLFLKICFLFFVVFVVSLNLFLAALGLRCCRRAFSSCGQWGLLFVVVCGLLIAVASLVAEHGL